ncbi:condensation domain-containing protein [Amycolatopsis sp. NPDC089917]|uniref:condensation domain-containing protein n=1 Tax=Amycolatopsis sp. NPDC089917 TaxID=3155187 RepID=UPI00343AAC99
MPSESASVWHVATPTQQGIWIVDRIDRLRPTYLIPSVIEFTGPIDHGALADAISRALARHPALRSRFRLETTHRRVEYRTDGEPAEAGFLDAVEEDWTTDELERLVEVLCYTPFDLGDEPPARAELIRVGPDTTVFVLTVHHIVFDATSRKILLDEIGLHYRAALTGEEVVLPEPVHPAQVQVPIPDSELAPRIADAVERLRGAPTTVDLPYDRRPDADLSMIGADARTAFDEEVTARVLAASAEAGCTAFMTGVAILAATLARRGAQRDFLFSVVWPGRDDPVSAGVVGMFMSTLVLRIRLDETTTWRELLREARNSGMETFIDADVPLDALAAELDDERDVGRLPMTPVLVNLAEVPAPFDLAPGVVGRFRPLEPQYSKWDLALFVHVADGSRLELTLDYPADLFSDETIDGLLLDLRRGVADLARSPEEPVLKPATEALDLDDPAVRLDLVRGVWSEVLDNKEFGDDVSFFDAGGDSLRLVVLVEKLREVSGRMVKTVDLFRAGTVRGHADLLVNAEKKQAGGARGSRERLLGAVRERRAVEPQA